MKLMSEDNRAVKTLGPAARTTTATGTGVDLMGFNGCLVLINGGLWTDGTHTFSLEHCDDDATYVTVPAGDMDATPPVVSSGSNDETLFQISYVGSKRYLRAKCTVTGSPSTGLVWSAMILRMDPTVRPSAAVVS